MRENVIGWAQMSPIQKAECREAVIDRMLALMAEAQNAGCGLVVFPELCLTTFFPRWYFEEQSDVDFWFEKPPDQIDVTSYSFNGTTIDMSGLPNFRYHIKRY